MPTIYSDLDKSLQETELIMVDVDTFITALYVMADDFAKTRNSEAVRDLARRCRKPKS